MSYLPEEQVRLFEQVATLLEYPGIGYDDKLLAALDLGGTSAAVMALDGAAVAADLARGAQRLADLLVAAGESGAEEHFTVLFDLSPVCTLNVGHHLFGDAYQRGELLAGLVGELARRGIPVGDEIPDHLPLLLRLLTRMEDAEDRQLLASAVLLPGLQRINEALADNDAPWSDILRSLPAVVQRVVPDAVSMIEHLPLNTESRDPIGYQEAPPRA